jgi:glutathione S-transferase
MPEIELISFKLCPFVQRSVITLEEKGVPYTITYIDLNEKPKWFTDISPLGKVPVLRVDDTVIFESAVINEYIEETTGGGMHPADPIARAHNRAWIEFSSTIIMDSYQMLMAPSETLAREKGELTRGKLARLEAQVKGPLFNGADFSLVDAAVAPLLQRLAWYQAAVPSFDFYRGLPKVAAWRDALFARPAFQRSTVPEILDENAAYMRRVVERAKSPGDVPWFIAQAMANSPSNRFS